ncbi:MAG TPA: hypothetical protein VLU25_06620 [Acidobacteriota bacterium]|nr:hypothetical protein [Acidobacteriota bacterium]
MAKDLYFRRDLAAARQAFEKALEHVGSPDRERAEAALALARIEWRFYRDWEQAHSYLEKAETLDGRTFSATLERAEILRRQQHLKQALATARQALSQAETSENRIEALTMVGRLLLLPPEGKGDQGPEFRASQRAVEETLAQLSPLMQENRGRLGISRLVLGLALRSDDGAAALDAWRSYYWVPANFKASPDNEGATTDWDYPLLSGAHSVLSKQLPHWAGPDSPLHARAAVVKALADARLFHEAAWLATDPRLPPEESIHFSEVVAYHRFLAAVEESANEYYRRRALGKGANRELQDGLMAAARPLWQSLHGDDSPARLSLGQLVKKIGERFGAYIYFQTHGDIRSLNMGHRIVDSRQLVEQYGHKAEVRLIVLDSMVSNGYNSWFWDGEAAAGGWVDEEGAIVQVRPSYADGPLRAWNRLTDPEERRRIDKRIKEQTSEDDLRARTDRFAYLPGLALRLRRQAGQKLLTELRSRGLKGPDLKLAFINELNRRIQASSIFAHEGRHALDFRDSMRNFFRSGAEKEFRAKLSEVALAPDPRIALTGGILTANIGDDSSHGQANLRIMKGLVKWMTEHQAGIQGFDQSRPVLPQLDLLTDDQLREAFRSMDPWAK